MKVGYTLIEIMVVMSIIAILAGILFSGAKALIDTARKTDARNTASNLRNAIAAYHSDYRRYPAPAGSGGKAAHVDYVSDDSFMEILLGARTDAGRKLNPKGTPYFSGRTAKRLGANRFVNGISLSQSGSGAGSLWDPWGYKYGLRIDSSNQGQMANPAHNPPSLSGSWAPQWGRGTSTELKYLSESVVVWSSGKEADIASDNVVTW